MNNIIKYQLPERMSSTGVAYDWLFSFVFWASMILFVFVIAIMIYFVVRYHRSRHPESAQTHDHTKLELRISVTG